MLFGSFERRNQRARENFAELAALLALIGCGNRFSASVASGGQSDNAGSAGESPSEGGARSNGGESGSGGESGDASAGTTNTAGSGGQPPTTCDCTAGTYCQDGTLTCLPCADFSILEFAAPEKLATLSQTPSGNERFPRPASAGSDLFYRAGSEGATALWYAPTPVSGIGHRLFAAAGSDDSGPLLAAGLLAQNFFFDRLNPTTNVRQIMAGAWTNAQLTDVVAAPAPFNTARGDYSIAIAPDVGRAYWMRLSTATSTGDLLWATFGKNATPAVVLDLEIKVGTGKSCPRSGDDATPWVNAAGTVIFFRSESVNESCVATDSGAFDLFAAALGGDGLPLTPGIPLSTLNNTGGASTETDPSLSQDACTIYYASNNDNGNYDLYRAARN